MSSRRPEDDIFEQVAGPKGTTAEAAPIIDLVDLVIKSALKSRASDIHIEPTENNVVIRHRLDGLLKEVMELPKWVHDGLIARMKIMGGMDIAEKRLPQDGRIKLNCLGKEIDVRVSVIPNVWGEGVCLRLLDRANMAISLEGLGMPPEVLTRFQQDRKSVV